MYLFADIYELISNSSIEYELHYSLLFSHYGYQFIDIHTVISIMVIHLQVD